MTAPNLTISVVIPAYNAAHFLPRSLGSVFAQTLPPHEVIVVDDGSTDSTAQVAAQLGAKVVRRTNGGLAAARNTGIKAAIGDWIALLDADDSWSPEKLERQVAAIDDGTVLVYTGIRFYDDRGTRSIAPAMEPSLAIKTLRFQNPIPVTYLVRRDALLHGGGYREDVRACEDWEMLVRLSRLGRFQCVPEPLMHCYLHSDSLSANPETMLRALEQIIDSTLLNGLTGIRRWIWRRRIWARQLLSAALIARDNNLKGELGYALRSLLSWPSPFWESRRFAVFAVSLRNQLLSKRKSL